MSYYMGIHTLPGFSKEMLIQATPALEQLSQTPRHRLMSLTRAKPVEGSWSKQVTHTRATASGDHACWQGRPRQRATLGVQNSTQAYAVVPRCGVG